MEHHDIERRLDRLEAQVEAGFNKLNEDMVSLFRNGPISKLSERMTVAESKLVEQEQTANVLRRVVWTTIGTLLASAATAVAAHLVGAF